MQIKLGAIITWLTHWGWGKMAAILQTAFSNAFSWMKMYEFGLIFHWSLFLSFQLTISQYLVFWTHKIHPIYHTHGWDIGCLLWVFREHWLHHNHTGMYIFVSSLNSASKWLRVGFSSFGYKENMRAIKACTKCLTFYWHSCCHAN